MFPLPRGAVWQTLFLLSAVLFINEVRSEGRVVCYYTNWSVYRPGTAKFNPQNINPYLCTHLVYAFGGFTKDNQMKPFDKYQDIEQGGYAKFTGLKTYNKQLKTMIAIGGWNEASSRFSPLVASPERRQQFIKNILKFLRQNHFDGIDLDWEYPAHREGGKPRDRDNYAQFVQELRAEFERESEKTGRPRLLVTMAVPAGIEYIDKGYDIPKLNKYLDWFNLLTYDFHSSHEPAANHHAPLYSLEEESEYNYDTELNIDYSVKYYLKAGADRDKLVLGIPTYGRSYTLINEESTELGAPSEGPGEQGDATREKGYLAYYEICQNLKDDPEWTVVQPNPNAMGPYAFRRNQWVGYDDEDIVRKKAQYVVDHGLGGIMFWAIDNDDFRGTCTGKPYPLIEAAKEAMLDSLGLGINEVAKPSSPKKPVRSRSRENSSSTRNRIGGGEIIKAGQKRIQSTTTTAAPSTTIKLTEAEGSSLYIGGRTTTPPPPTTPDPGSDFKCEEEGFFQHPRDCKKYYWCLDSGPSGLGIVAHMFTCPSGLYFNPAADSCDFARNVPCKIKKATTAAPVTSTTTTPRTTTVASSNRITAATSRNSFLRTTTRRTTTTTTTTAAPEEEEIEYVDEDDAPTQVKDRDAEEDPKVIKELIELIRKVGGIEELEKHLLRKEDGSILLKEESSSSGVPTTQSTISKSLYDKVLSRPNTYNSFRNRFASGSLFKNTEQTKATSETETQVQEEGRSSNNVGGGSKYSSVVRGNSRQGPQNAGLDKLADFDGFLKEKKQYVTINRNRGTSTRSQNDTEDDEDEETEEALDENDENGESVAATVDNLVRKDVASSTPAYTSIRRTRPTTTAATKTEIDEQTEKELNEKKIYATLNRYRGRLATTVEPEAEAEIEEEVVSTTRRYKYQERQRPTKYTEQPNADDDNSNDEDNDEADEHVENHENVMSHLTDDSSSSTQKSQTTRIYASIGRRKTTTPATPTETPITTTTSTATSTTTTNKTNQLDTTISNESTTPELQTTATKTTSTLSQTTTTTTFTPTNTPEIITTSIDSNPIQSTSTISTLSSTNTISSASDDSNSLYDSTTIPPVISSLSSVDSSEENLSDLSHSINSLAQEIALPTTESSGLDTTKQDGNDNPTTATTPTTTSTAKTTTKTLTTTGTTDTDSHEGDDKLRTPTTALSSTTITRRPILSVRRRLIGGNTLNGATTGNNNDLTTTELPTAATSKFNSNNIYNNSNRRIRPGITTTAASFNTNNNNNNNYLTTRYKTKATAITAAASDLSVASSSSSSSSSSTATSANDITQRQQNKYASPALRRKFQPQRRIITTTTTAPEELATEQQRTPNPLFKRRYSLPTSTLAPPLLTTTTTSTSTTTTNPALTIPTLLPTADSLTTTLYIDGIDNDEASDQVAKSSIHSSLFNQIIDDVEDEETPRDVKLPSAIITKTKIERNDITTTTIQPPPPPPPPPTAQTSRQQVVESITRRIDSINSGNTLTTRKPNINRRPQQTTPNPPTALKLSTQTRGDDTFANRRRPHKVAEPLLGNLNSNQEVIRKKTKTKISTSTAPGRTYRPINDYDYYDDEDARVIGNTSGQQLKVILHGHGIIECLDQGNFPHPLSCRKFISCAKFETGGVVGWEYTCPKGLSYDPVGGMCNWAAGLGCKD